MLISIRHATRYVYATDSSYAVQSLRLAPQSFASQRVKDWSVTVSAADKLLAYTDAFGNAGHLATVNVPHKTITIEAGGTVETEDRSGLVTGLHDPMPSRVFMRVTPLTAPDDAIKALAEDVSNHEPLERMHRLSAAVRERIEYAKGASGAATKAAEALAAGRGVCQDFSHVFISAARLLEIPARYVTGYMVVSDAPEEIASEAHHAWVEALVPGLGWIGFDVANSICPTDRYVRLACGLDAQHAAPVRGTRRGGAAETLAVEVTAVPDQPFATQSQSQAQGAGTEQTQAQVQSMAPLPELPAAGPAPKTSRSRKKSPS